MYLNIRRNVLAPMAIAAVGLILTSVSAFAQGTKVGATQYPIDGFVRFPSVSYDEVHDAYLVTHGHGAIMARYVSAAGVPLGQAPVNVSPGSQGAARAACGGSPNVCLVAWLYEPYTVMGRLVSYGTGGTVSLIGQPFVIATNTLHKWPEGAPAIAYASSGSGEFLVTWTEGNLRIRGRRVTKAGTPVGSEFLVAADYDFQFLPSATYNSQADEYVVAYQAEHGNYAIIAAQAVKPGADGPLRGPSPLIQSVNEKYPEIAYNSTNNTFLATSWHEVSTGNWIIHGQIANGNLSPTSSPTSPLTLAYNAGGIGIGLAYNPISNVYLAVHQHPQTDGINGVIISSTGTPGVQFKVMDVASNQPESKIAGSSASGHFLAASNLFFGAVMTQLVQASGGGGAGAPTTPTLVSPASTISTTTPTFTWNASAGAEQYRLWVTDSGGVKYDQWLTAAQVGCSGGTGTCSYAPGVTLANGNAWFWVMAWNNAGGYSNWSASRSFAIASATVPTLISPTTTVAVSPIGFQWTAVSGATYYEVWVNDQTGNKYDRWVTAAEAGCAGGGTCSWNATFYPNSLVPGNAVWWIRGWGPSAGYMPWSGSQLFAVAGLAAPTLITPNGAGVGSAIEFGWTAVLGATYYHIWVNDPTGPRFQQWYTAAQVSCPTGSGLCSITVSPSLNSGTGFWWVQAFNGTVGSGPWSLPLTFIR